LTEMVQNSPKLFLKIETQYVDYENLASVKKVLNNFPGICSVIIFYEHDHRKIQLPEEYSVDPTTKCLLRLKSIIGERNVVLK
jgi:DNA polymerase-3 subunit alpha